MKSENLIPRRIRCFLTEVGIGGWDCPCCTPPDAILRTLNRQIRRKLKQELNKELKKGEHDE